MANKYISNIVIYQAKSGAIELRGDFKAETIWATQAQITKLFGVDRTVITRHLNNIIREGELDQKSNVQKMHIANSDRPAKLYSLDVILALGYRTNSKIAIEFRKWTTKVLKTHIIEGYTINRSRIAKNYDEFIKTVEEVRSLLPSGIIVDSSDALELIKLFADTWFSLDAYDKDKLKTTGATKKAAALTADQLVEVLTNLKKEINGENFFGVERESGNLKAIIGDVLQSFANKDLYPTIEEKAAHLLYFMVKNHPFIDGNKRCGAYSFIWFLRKFGNLNLNKITPAALTALTILVAESNPKDKARIINLILQIL
ncbi:MAG: virulence protein RhuM/Fic/DOC family protein [Patescibacteria group bacterium]